MPKKNKAHSALLCLCLVLFFIAGAAGAEESVSIKTDTIWTKDTPNLVFNKPVVVGDGATLTIEKGARVVFQNDPDNPFSAPGIVVSNGKLAVNGTSEENVVFTSSEDGFVFSFNDNSRESLLRYATVEKGGFIPSFDGAGDFVPRFPVVAVNGGKIKIENSKFADSRFQEIVAEDAYAYDADGNPLSDEDGYDIMDKIQVSVINSNFSNQEAVVSNLDCWAYDEDDNEYIDQECLKRMYLKDDWFGDPAGPTTDQDEEDGVAKGYRVSGMHYLDSWRASDELLGDAIAPACTENCFSNVLFLPGIKASKLYMQEEDGDEDQLWPPNYFGDDLEDLFLDGDGGSIKDVYTKDVLEKSPTGGTIYKLFIDDLADLKSSQIINDYEAFAYDWRQSVEDVAQNGTPYENITKSAIVDLQALAESSKSKKVTIVAHSNGGLVAKALVMELEKMGMADKVDKIIFVGTPQMGTPISILSLLYGYNEESTFLQVLISQEEARTLSENMPGAYGLLPSEKYFERMESPFIKFLSENTRYESFKDAYGDNVGSFDEFSKFLLGKDDGREDPDEDDVEMENVLNEKLLNQAKEIHQRLDNWVPPSTIKVIQIAGWGLDTVSGVEYAEKEEIECVATTSLIPACAKTGEYEPFYEPKFTVDGDRVVVAPSALMLVESENVKRYWLDIRSQNKGFDINREHKNLTEIESVRDMLNRLIKNSDLSLELPEFIKSSRPDDYVNAQPRLRMSLYSPLDIHLYDDAGHHTGPKKITDENGQERLIFEEEIPNSYYYQFGERKYVGFPTGEHIRVEMDGYALGSYTLKMEEIQTTQAGEETIAQTVFENLPTTTDTTVKLDIPEAGIENPLFLQADIDNDGTSEYELTSIPDGVVTLDMIAPVSVISIAGTKGSDSWCIEDVDVVFTAQDNEGGSGVDKISYSLDNGVTWNEYDNPIVIFQEGINTIQYYSTDKQGNKEKIKTETIKIDKTAPEAKMQFNPDTQKLDIIGVDNLTQDVSVALEERTISDNGPEIRRIRSWLLRLFYGRQNEKTIATATLTDEAGHATKIVFEKIKDKDNYVRIALNKLVYGDIENDLMDTGLQYKWQIDRKKQYRLLASHIRTKSTALESHYLSRKNQTWLMEKPRELADDDRDDDSEKRPVIKKLEGMAIPSLMTDQGGIKIQY